MNLISFIFSFFVAIHSLFAGEVTPSENVEYNGAKLVHFCYGVENKSFAVSVELDDPAAIMGTEQVCSSHGLSIEKQESVSPNIDWKSLGWTTPQGCYHRCGGPPSPEHCNTVWRGPCPMN